MIRSFPALLLIAVALAVPRAHADSKAELKDLRERLEKLQRDYQSTRESHADAADSLRASERAISETKRRLQQLEGEQQKTRSELKTLNEELTQVQDSISQRQSRLATLLKETYMRGGGDSLKLLLSGKDPNQISRQLVYLSYLSQSQLELINALRQELDQLTRLKQAVAGKDETLAEIKQSKEAEQGKLLKEKQARQTVLDQLAGKIRVQRKEIHTLQRDEKRLADLLARLAKLAKQQKARADKSRKTTVSKTAPAKAPGPVAVITEVPEAVYGDTRFSKLKGRLRLPLQGELMNRFGAPREGGGLSWKGLFIRAREGAEVKSVAAGRVVFADWLRGFGNLVIVDHGEGYMSLYSNNESLYKQPGEGVKTGDTIASAGNSGGQEEPGVYFELRHQGRPINPMTWIK